MPNPKKHHPAGPGRPPKSAGEVERMGRYTIYLPDDVADAIRGLGNGNLSAGIRILAARLTTKKKRRRK
tara:strand:- start:4069 stop:4275 length:207 start_codon:yes stop_codon:yes gene_type:complete